MANEELTTKNEELKLKEEELEKTKEKLEESEEELRRREEEFQQTLSVKKAELQLKHTNEIKQWENSCESARRDYFKVEERHKHIKAAYFYGKELWEQQQQQRQQQRRQQRRQHRNLLERINLLLSGQASKLDSLAETLNEIQSRAELTRRAGKEPESSNKGNLILDFNV
jgi:hypothetical protein